MSGAVDHEDSNMQSEFGHRCPCCRFAYGAGLLPVQMDVWVFLGTELGFGRARNPRPNNKIYSPHSKGENTHQHSYTESTNRRHRPQQSPHASPIPKPTLKPNLHPTYPQLFMINENVNSSHAAQKRLGTLRKTWACDLHGHALF